MPQIIHSHTTHTTKSPTYKAWENMVQRCTNPKHGKWEYYGGRGIAISPEYRTFAGFLNGMGERPEGMTLDRIDFDGNYEPGNCRWSDMQTQKANRRARRFKEYCKRGHPLSGDNVRVRILANGYINRTCKKCAVILQREQRIAAKEGAKL